MNEVIYILGWAALVYLSIGFALFVIGTIQAVIYDRCMPRFWMFFFGRTLVCWLFLIMEEGLAL